MSLYLVDDIEARYLPDHLSLYCRDRGEPVILIRRYALSYLNGKIVGIQRTYIRMYRIDLRYMRDQVLYRCTFTRNTITPPDSTIFNKAQPTTDHSTILCADPPLSPSPGVPMKKSKYGSYDHPVPSLLQYEVIPPRLPLQMNPLKTITSSLSTSLSSRLIKSLSTSPSRPSNHPEGALSG